VCFEHRQSLDKPYAPSDNQKKLSGHESQIEPWLAPRHHHTLFGHHNRVNLLRTRTARASQHEMGWKAPQRLPFLPVAGDFFLLTFPFYRTGFSVTGNRRKPLSGNPTFLRTYTRNQAPASHQWLRTSDFKDVSYRRRYDLESLLQTPATGPTLKLILRFRF
jgi:hypothetical protein